MFYELKSEMKKFHVNTEEPSNWKPFYSYANTKLVDVACSLSVLKLFLPLSRNVFFLMFIVAIFSWGYEIRSENGKPENTRYRQYQVMNELEAVSQRNPSFECERFQRWTKNNKVFSNSVHWYRHASSDGCSQVTFLVLTPPTQIADAVMANIE